MSFGKQLYAQRPKKGLRVQKLAWFLLQLKLVHLIEVLPLAINCVLIIVAV